MGLPRNNFFLWALTISVVIEGAPVVRNQKRQHVVTEVTALGSTLTSPCSWRCSREFVHGCMGRFGPKDYRKCRQAIDSGTSYHLNKRGQCVPRCQDTQAMRALAPPDLDSCTRQSRQCSIQVAGGSYTIHMKVLGSGGKLIILQHGSGGRGEPMLNLLSGSDVQNAVLIAPTYDVGDHLAFEEIVKLAGALPFVNLAKGIAVVGHSKGCGAVIQLLMHNHDRRFKQFACFATQLRPDLYNEGKFFKSGKEVHPPKFQDRRIGFFSNEGDRVIPFQGGRGVGITFHSVPHNIAIWAKHYGGCNALEQMHMKTLRDGVTEISYLNGSIASYSTTANSHGMELNRPTIKEKFVALVGLGA